MSSKTHFWDAPFWDAPFCGALADFRSAVTLSISVAAVPLLLPFVAMHLLHQNHALALGNFGIVLIFACNAWLVTHRRCHQHLSLFALFPAATILILEVFRQDGIVGSVWCYPMIIACYCMLSKRKAILANFAILALILPMVWQVLDPVLAARISASLIAVSVFTGILVSVIDSQHRRLHYQLEHDPLTGLLNRSSLKRQLQEAMQGQRNRGTTMSVLALDLDHFKSVNDQFGHDVGDHVLCTVGSLIHTHVRGDDSVFRLGGEEFLVLLRGADTENAHRKAESLRRSIKAAHIVENYPITVSIGVAELRADDGDDWGGWITRADKQLYVAKRAGRNCVASETKSLQESVAKSSMNKTTLNQHELAV